MSRLRLDYSKALELELNKLITGENGLRFYLQPIVFFKNRTLFAYEVLSRGACNTCLQEISPFDYAAEYSIGKQLDKVAFTDVFKVIDAFPGDTIFLNTYLSNLGALYEILKNSEGSIVRQYENAFRAYGIESLFSDDGLKEIALQAFEEKTGARGLMTVCERALRDYKFELPTAKIPEFVISKNLLQEPQNYLQQLLQNPNDNISFVAQERVRRFKQDFFDKTGFQVEFEPDALILITRTALTTQTRPEQVCANYLKFFEHGLNLIRQNSGQTKFLFSASALSNPNSILENWIRQSYNHQN